MTNNPKDVEQTRKLLRSAAVFQEYAADQLDKDNYAICAALCHQSAMRMMAAVIQLYDKTVGLATVLEPVAVWGICAMLREELNACDSEAPLLADCKWADYPPDPQTPEPDEALARQAVHSLKVLRKAILAAVHDLPTLP